MCFSPHRLENPGIHAEFLFAFDRHPSQGPLLLPVFIPGLLFPPLGPRGFRLRKASDAVVKFHDARLIKMKLMSSWYFLNTLFKII